MKLVKTQVGSTIYRMCNHGYPFWIVKLTLRSHSWDEIVVICVAANMCICQFVVIW